MRLLLIFMLLPASVLAQNYSGDLSCLGGMCHSDKYVEYKNSGHPHQLYHNNGYTPPSYTWPFTSVPPLPTVNGLPLEWSDVHYVIGNYYWKARFLDETGAIITGESGDMTQWNLQFDNWSSYHPGETMQYDCAPCHTTGYTEYGIMPNYPNIVGGWYLDGVQCEACHGPCSSHVVNSAILTPGGLECGECHYRDRQNRLIWQDGFLLDRQEAVELYTGGMTEIACEQCHEPHRSTVYDLGGIPSNFDCSSCDGHSPEPGKKMYMDQVMEGVDCIDCHMPYMDISAGSVNQYKADVRSHIYGILPLPIYGYENTYQIGDTTYWQLTYTPSGDIAKITLDYACLGCHIDNGIPLTIEEAAEMAQGFHVEPLVSINLTAANPPVIIPPDGGSFDFSLNGQNNQSYELRIDFWSDITDPNGIVTDHILFTDITLQPGETFYIDSSYALSAAAEEGAHMYRAYVQEHVWQELYDHDVFAVQKQPGSLSIDFAPYNPPILIPPEGGSFDFNLTIANNQTGGLRINYWAEIVDPAGLVDTLISAADTTLQIGSIIQLDGQYSLPTGTLAGEYTCSAFARDQITLELYDQESFYLEKEGNSSVVTTSDGAAIEMFELNVYPNPFNATTVLSYQLHVASMVNLAIYDIYGRKVAELINSQRGAGVHQVTFDSDMLSSGVYVARLTTNQTQQTTKFVLLK
ncbi:hypothetical protein CEE37_02405 [candidate division LCP-89 bacterium B3_LCP]|uniref:Uncharacterized protein n=1 Tax=candidate division LCP-89 bacterium B3_LCP TaxID=2012998 RepID=A0A532V5U0_UNCL8|nr:MAG: hypothetical protein CEE37_02405 [candidate division LCP-89 bacterium B3_LCP]